MNEKLKAIIDQVKSGDLKPAEGLQKIFELLDESKASKDDLTEVKTALETIEGIKKDITELVGKVDEIKVGGTRNDDEHQHGFKHMGEFARAIATASMPGVDPSEIDERLHKGREKTKAMVKAGATSPATTGNVSDVGLIPPAFGQELWQGALDESDLLSDVDHREIDGNTVVETYNKKPSEWSATGVQAYWTGEGAKITESKPEHGTRTARLHALKVLVPVSNEALEDAAYLAGEIMAEGRDAISWKADDAIINGTGSGMPLGVLKSAALVSVAKEAGQAADTIVGENITSMWARMPGRYKSRARWIVNDDTTGQFPLMTIGDQPVFMPPNGLVQEPNGMMMGRPLRPGQHAATLGDKGDITLMDPQQYKAITKSGGIRTASSMHLWFDHDETAFRLVFRMDGYPKLAAAIAPKRGAATLSAYVTLAARA